jgi:hypothetical protein
VLDERSSALMLTLSKEKQTTARQYNPRRMIGLLIYQSKLQ